ncbi:MAG: OmpH family outer membrane protein [Bacteroidaceae bacterium]|nr:OmpH family outer membrane protein [Bacteroidaceae bacterium]MCR4769848.1 OmpH family outer membrane protein [Bacteroidaceae bacterium]
MKKLILAALVALPMSVFAQKFAHVNSTTIIQSMPEYTAAQNELQKLGKQYEEELTRMQDELKTKLEDYQKNGSTLLDAMKQRREQELQDLNQRLEQYYQTSQQDIAKKQQEKMAEISEKVQKAIKEVGTSGGYVYVMDVTSGIPFINESLSTDVTTQVKTKLGLK